MKAKYQILTLGAAGIITCIGAANASSLTYQSSVTNSFTINESVSIELSSDELKIDNLTPGQSADSNVITITTESNAGKFTLSSTVGNSIYDTTDLVQSDVDDKFSILSSSGDLGFGEWGFKLSTKTGDNNEWIDWSPSYSGLPIYSDAEASPVNLVTDANAKTTIAFKIGAKASASQAAGEYNNVINFIATATPTTTPAALCSATIPNVSLTYMQDITSSNKTTVMNNMVQNTQYALKDKRDGKTYCIAKLADNKVWMVQNLAIEPGTAMTKDDTNIASTYTASNPYTLPGDKYDLYFDGKSSGTAVDDKTSSGYCYSTTGRTNACTHVATDKDVSDVKAADSSLEYTTTQLGAWYNYAAATAKTIADSSNSDPAVYDICPKGWRLPNDTGNTTGGEIYDLMTALNKDSDALAAFNPLYGGYYANGNHNGAGTIGYWWSSTAFDTSSRYGLRYYGGSLNTSDSNRQFGFYVRCTLAS